MSKAHRTRGKSAMLRQARVTAVCLASLLVVALASSAGCRPKVTTPKTAAPTPSTNSMHAFTLTWAELPSGPRDGEIRNPTPRQIDEILEPLSRGGDGFAILSMGDERYIQTSAGTDNGNQRITVEYRAGGADAHFELDEPVRNAQRLKQLFHAYLADPNTISQQGRWKPLTF